MQPELDLISTRELIDEIMRRRTFLGVIVHATEELKDLAWNDERAFKVHYNGNLDSAGAVKLLEMVASHIHSK